MRFYSFLFEDGVEDSPQPHELSFEKVEAEDGWIEVPDSPGLGATLDEDFLNSKMISESGAA